jgi:plastocyanin
MKKIFFAILGLSMLATACKKMQVDAPDLEITPQSTTLKAGDTATFNFSGYADYISFYSGETGRNYDKKDSFTRAGASPEFQFTSAVSAAGTGITTGNNLSVLVSTDFNGTYDVTNVKQATWTDITSRVTLATTTTAVNSPVVNLNDLKVEGKPMYVAYRYVTSNPTLKQRQWTISNFVFRTKFQDGTQYNHATSNADAVFTPVNVTGDSATWASGTTLVHTGLNANYPADEDWAISKQFDLTKATSLDATRGSSDALGVVTVKNLALTGIVPSSFKWKYATAGTYNAAFVIRNATVANTQEVVKRFTITVNP